MNGHRKITLVALALFGALISTDAAAQQVDTKYYNGNSCNAYRGSEADVFFRSYNGIAHVDPDLTQPNRRWVTCPFVSDARLEQDVFDAWVRLTRWRPVDATYPRDYCYFIVRTLDNSWTGMVNIVNGAQGTSRHAFPAGANQPANDSTFSIMCYLAGDTIINNYGATEAGSAY